MKDKNRAITEALFNENEKSGFVDIEYIQDLLNITHGIDIEIELLEKRCSLLGLTHTSKIDSIKN